MAVRGAGASGPIFRPSIKRLISTEKMQGSDMIGAAAYRNSLKFAGGMICHAINVFYSVSPTICKLVHDQLRAFVCC
jgi:hypothetical protein